MTTPLMDGMCNAVWTFAKTTPETHSVNVVQSHLLRAMTKNHIDPTTICEEGCNIGFYMAAMGNVHYLKACEQLGVDFSHRNHRGETALFYLFGAAPMLYLVEPSTQPEPCANFLLKTCALTDINTEGQTPLFGLHKMVEEDGMFSNIISQDLRSMPTVEYPLYIRHYEKLLHYAVQCGVDLSHKDHSGRCFIDPAPLDQSGINNLLLLFFEWHNKIDKVVLTKELSGLEAICSKRRL